MKKYALILIIVVLSLLLSACDEVSDDSTFSIQFIDVGQGDAALVECDGHYMLIDAGDKSHGDKVYQVLQEKKVQKLDILAISHFHEDHVGGLVKVLSYATSIGRTISNVTERNNDTFRKIEHELQINGSEIEVPSEGDEFRLGSATVEVVYNKSDEDNDSLVLLITYGKTRFLFTGDIEYKGQKELVEKYTNGGDGEFKIDVIKMPHHGSWGDSGANYNDLNRLIRTFNPTAAVISVGEKNTYGHPHKETLDLLKQAEVKTYRTDLNGDVIVKSNGKTISITTSK